MERNIQYRLDCNWCRYNLSVGESLLPWAYQTMETHANKLHPAQVEAAKEVQNVESSSSPSVSV